MKIRIGKAKRLAQLKSKQIKSEPRQKPDPTRIDPTRTTMLRRRFMADASRRFDKLKRKIFDLLVQEDALGLRAKDRIAQAYRPVVNEDSHEFSSTQINLGKTWIMHKIKYLQEGIDPSHVHEKGIEREPHVTVRYGLHDDEPTDAARIIMAHGRVRMNFKKTSLFVKPGEYDVVKVDVDSPDLERLHAALGELPNTTTFAEYRPHLTIAYVKPGMGQFYEGLGALNGVHVYAHYVVFSDKESNHTQIELAGLPQPTRVYNERWRFLTSEQQVERFQAWLQLQILADILGKSIIDDVDTWLKKYIDEGFRKGLDRAFLDVRKPQLWTGVSPTDRRLDFFRGTRAEFLRDSFSRPVSLDRVKLLAARALNDLRGITEAMSQQIVRELVDGMIRGESPRTVARSIAAKVDSIGKARALTLARTETIRAHAEGQLIAFERLGVQRLGVAVEWATSGLGITSRGNPSPCEVCAPMKGTVFSLKEAKGLIPRHPNCMCSFIPANVGEDQKGQKRSKTKLIRALEASLTAESSKNKKRSMAQIKKRSSWPGADLNPSQDRPRSTVL